MRKPSLPARRSLRLQGYDYRQNGAYFVTICACQNSCQFGQIREGRMIANDLGIIVTECWQHISQIRRGVEVDAYVLMQNHIHGIILKFDEESADGGTQSYPGIDRAASNSHSDSLGVIVGQFKRAVTIRSKSLSQRPEQPIWQRNFYEHIIRNERSLDDIRKYIYENPARWLEDSLYLQ